jgi:acetoin utilization protein AcuB
MTNEIIRDWMSTDVVTIPADTTLPDAFEIMINEEIRRLPVVEETASGRKRLVGIISWGDLREARPTEALTGEADLEHSRWSTLTVRDVMTPDPITVKPDDLLAQAALAMLANRASGLPVVDNDSHLVGIITESDIFSKIVVDQWG